MHSRTLAVAVGVLSLVLGLWTVIDNLPAMGVAAGAVGLVAGLLSLVPDQSTPPEVVPNTEQPSPRSAAALSEAQLESTTPAGRPPIDPEPIDPTDAGLLDGSTGAGADLLNDPETDLFSEAYLRVALESRLASARRHLRPVAVALLEVTEGIPDELTVAAPPERVADAITETIREADIACRLNDGHFAVILEDTPENGAVWTVERIRRNLVSRYGHHTMWAGVACYPAHAFDSTELMAQAYQALEAAKEWKQDRIEVAASD